MAAKRTVRQVQASTLMSAGVSASTSAASIPSKPAADKLQLAKRLASKINLTN